MEKHKTRRFIIPPTRKIINYFQVAHAIAGDLRPDSPKPPRTFATSTTAIHLALKPHLRTTISDASELFNLPDLHDAMCRYLDRSSTGEPLDISGRRQATATRAILSDKIHVWTKIRVQLRTWNPSDPGLVEPAQTLVVAPPSTKYPAGRYDCGIASLTSDSSWPTQGLSGLLRFLISPTYDTD